MHASLRTEYPTLPYQVPYHTIHHQQRVKVVLAAAAQKHASAKAALNGKLNALCLTAQQFHSKLYKSVLTLTKNLHGLNSGLIPLSKHCDDQHDFNHALERLQNT